MSAENRMAKFSMQQSMRPDNQDFWKLRLDRENKYQNKRQYSAHDRLTQVKEKVMKMVLGLDAGLSSRGIAPPASYLEEAYFSNEQT